MHAHRFSCVQLSLTLVDCGLPGFSAHGVLQARALGLPCSPPGDLPDPGTEPVSFCDSYTAGDSLPLSQPGSPGFEPYDRY